MNRLNRRRVLRGMLNGGAVTVGLPLLNMFLNGNGTALASGEPMPVRFGTWSWGLGMNAKVFIPEKTGFDYELTEEIASWAPVKQHINLFTNLTAYLDNMPLLGHSSGWIIQTTGSAPKDNTDIPGETIDVTIANQIGRSTRFKSLTATATGDVKDSISYENSNTPNAAEWSPIEFYTRLFGPEFQDPNADSFTPDPKVMVRKSVLSGVMEETSSLMKKVGMEDRARLDQYFTGLRHLEKQFEHRLTKPEPIEACRPGAEPGDTVMGREEEVVAGRHKIMAELLAMAVACDQTRVFNMVYSIGASSIIRPGYAKPHHTTTHEEPIDHTLGYQPIASWFTRRAMESWANYVHAFANFEEGDGTLLDNVLIYAMTDVGNARIHSVDGMPAFMAGRAGGRIKTGMHIDAGATTVARLGYTALRVMGVDTPSWGTNSNNVSDPVGEILA